MTSLFTTILIAANALVGVSVISGRCAAKTLS
jgi:hypothetical protein